MNNLSSISQAPHRRKNLLTDEWILVSPGRNNRPWQGQQESNNTPVLPSYDNACYLCPGNTRNTGDQNPNYSNVFVFKNDFSALVPYSDSANDENNGFFIRKTERGICKVICFSPKHNLTLAEMETTAINSVVEEWNNQYQELAKLPYINYVQIFENKGAIMGCSNPHPMDKYGRKKVFPFCRLKNIRTSFPIFKKTIQPCWLITLPLN